MHIRTPARWLALSLAALPLALNASSHREAPQITETPKVDGTDFYMFRSYETGREGFVTLIANYLPLQNRTADRTTSRSIPTQSTTSISTTMATP